MRETDKISLLLSAGDNDFALFEPVMPQFWLFVLLFASIIADFEPIAPCEQQVLSANA